MGRRRPASHPDAAVDYRSASNFGCFAARGGAIAHAAPWAACELATEPSYSYYARRLVSAYDADNNYLVTDAEFRAAVEGLGMCCGPYCPFSSSCGAMLTSLPRGESRGESRRQAKAPRPPPPRRDARGRPDDLYPTHRLDDSTPPDLYFTVRYSSCVQRH